MTARAPHHPLPASHRRPRTPIHRRHVRNIFLSALFFVLGVIGIFVPIMPQIVFFFLSLLFLSMVSPRLRRMLRRFRRRHPSIDRAYAKWRERGRRKRLKLIRKARKFRHDIEERFDGRDHAHRS